MSIELNEPILDDDYPIYADYLYVADGKVIRSDWHEVTAKLFKIKMNIKELRRCDIMGRKKMMEDGQNPRDSQ